MKDTYVLGIGITHNSTACLLKNGEIVACVSEERFNRIKNVTTFPALSIKYVLESQGITIDDVSAVAHGYEWAGAPDMQGPANNNEGFGSIVEYVAKHEKLFHLTKDWYYRMVKEKYRQAVWKEITTKAGVKHVDLIDHHICHAFAAYYGFSPTDKETLVFTADGEGDGKCATANIANGPEFQILSSTKAGNSLAGLYGAITQTLGMKVNEHEYKVMGLAPYANDYIISEPYKVLEPLSKLNSDGTFYCKYGYRGLVHYFKKHMAGYRFDGIAGAAQKLVERLVEEWISAYVRSTGISKISLGGGLFMNVKANMKIMQLDSVAEIYPCPSAGDESTPIGAAFHAYRRLCQENGEKMRVKKIESLYLGPEYGDEEIEPALKSISDPQVKIEKHGDIEGVVADLLSKGKVVARTKGRMEWGARALGNRSILADPSNADAVREINMQIKSRDFWMPFAPSMLFERVDDYLENPKQVYSPFMMITFPTKPGARRKLVAAMHSYDFTCRPQMVKREINPDYYKLIKYFEDKTGEGAILNTSFNLHGEPIVCTPLDAISTFQRSGLQYLALGGYLLSKAG